MSEAPVKKMYAVECANEVRCVEAVSDLEACALALLAFMEAKYGFAVLDDIDDDFHVIALGETEARSYSMFKVMFYAVLNCPVSDDGALFVFA